MTTYGLYLRDLSHQRTRSHGIVNYAIGLAGALPAALTDHERLVLVANTEIAPLLPEHPRVVVEAQAPPPRRLRRVFDDHVAALNAAARHELRVLHFPKGFVPAWNPTGARLVATVHDDIPLRYWEGDWGPPDRSPRSAYFAWSLRHAVRRADAVVTVSAFTRAQLRRRWPAADPVVTGQAPSLPPVTVLPLHERRPVALHFGSALAHKRSLEGIRRTLRWIDDHPDRGLEELHVLGDAGDLGDVSSHPRLRLLPGGLSSADVAQHLAAARVLVFPSAYEGFGLPPLEAALLRTPVVYARIPALVEVLGEAAPCGYDPQEPDSFDQAMTCALAQDGADVEATATSLAARHRWEAVGEATLAVYRSVARG